MIMNWGPMFLGIYIPIIIIIYIYIAVGKRTTYGVEYVKLERWIIREWSK